MFIQVHSRSLNVVLSFETRRRSIGCRCGATSANSRWPSRKPRCAIPRRGARWSRRHARTTAQQERGRRRAARRQLQVSVPDGQADSAVSLDAEIAERANKDPVEVIIDLALEKHLKQFFLQPLANENQDHVLEMMRHPRSVVTFSDSGAHVSQIMDSSLQTHVLSHWVREKQAAHAGRSDPDADLRAGLALGPARTRPAARRIGRGRDRFRSREDRADAADARSRSARGRAPPEAEGDRPEHTVVNGQVLLRNNEHTGALPGQLLRGPLAR